MLGAGQLFACGTGVVHGVRGGGGGVIEWYFGLICAAEAFKPA